MWGFSHVHLWLLYCATHNYRTHPFGSLIRSRSQSRVFYWRSESSFCCSASECANSASAPELERDGDYYYFHPRGIAGNERISPIRDRGGGDAAALLVTLIMNWWEKFFWLNLSARGKVKNASVMSLPGKVCKNSNQVEITSERSKFCSTHWENAHFLAFSCRAKLCFGLNLDNYFFYVYPR